MTIFPTYADLRTYLQEKRRESNTIGLVPTMGALHKGHLTLIQESLRENDVTVCSIYVNPRQFNNTKDLAKYPRTLQADIQLLGQTGCHVVFHPSDDNMYQSVPEVGLSIGRLGNMMEGLHRPGHFEGMALVVNKFFNMVQPDKAYFGQKDLQQLRIIQRMVTDLSYNIEVRSCPIVRESDGLALSSRNKRLTKEERDKAPFIYESLQKTAKLLQNMTVNETKNLMIGEFSENSSFRLDYLEVCDANTLEPIAQINDGDAAAICIAAYLGDVRLIDNLLINS